MQTCRFFIRSCCRQSALKRSATVSGGSAKKSGWPDNQSCKNLVAWCRRSAAARFLIIVNLSDARSQGRVLLPWDELSGSMWQLTDVFTGEVHERYGGEMLQPGLFADLAPWGFHVLKFSA